MSLEFINLQPLQSHHSFFLILTHDNGDHKKNPTFLCLIIIVASSYDARRMVQ